MHGNPDHSSKRYHALQQQQLLLHLFNSPVSGTTRVSRYQKGKTSLDLLQQETVSGSGSSWAIWKSAPRLRQITMPAPHRPTNSVKALKDITLYNINTNSNIMEKWVVLCIFIIYFFKIVKFQLQGIEEWDNGQGILIHCIKATSEYLLLTNYEHFVETIHLILNALCDVLENVKYFGASCILQTN